ncbi:T9SS C-terminal target domain-containing protein [Chryseobacterium sp. G0186]|uniref:T9SS type A sorting domain-containing protein n=1 Tax=Chryseobacterium sp. G0186 TaxID=2487064 RepID=UPI000F4E8040|nr:T9SS type A sorting domain-containing protein [Chryseobacterium sp. G0186]AZA79184.1 T9SS C-terminal target domain-containing protein [Chryseobacterium sp. G0186]
MKSTTFFTICSLLISILSFGQTSSEKFEDENSGSKVFTDNGVSFNITSYTSTFEIGIYPGTGWSGTAPDNKYIDNTLAVGATNPSFSIKTTSNLFKANRFWVYVANQYNNQNATGTLTVTGKLNGVTKFSVIKTNNFAQSLGNTNGYTLIDLTNLNGQNYSNIVLDELRLTLGGDFYYLGFDAFTWVKDSGVVLGISETKASQKNLSIYPNPTNGPLSINTEKGTEAKIYSQDGKLLKSVQTQKGLNTIDISELPKGVYYIRTTNESTKVIKN